MILTAIAIVAVRAGNNPINSVDKYACGARVRRGPHCLIAFLLTHHVSDAMKVPLPCQAEETKSNACSYLVKPRGPYIAVFWRINLPGNPKTIFRRLVWASLSIWPTFLPSNPNPYSIGAITKQEVAEPF